MSEQGTTTIDPMAALNAIATENEWRKQRILQLENDRIQLIRRIEELEAAAPEQVEAEETPEREKPVKTSRKSPK